MLNTIKREVPRAFKPFLGRSRFKAAYGGRGGGKSHFFGEDLILRCFAEPTRAVCVREVQNTIRDSVRQLLIDKINKFGLGDFFETPEREIRGRNGSLIVFRGMQAYNAQNIKSLEDFDIAWVEEAQTLSEVSLRLLRPTIRKPGSELWFSWNPWNETDAVDQFFRGGQPPLKAIIREINYRDNPWFSEEMQTELEHDFRVNPEMAEHVWNGGYEIVSEAAYYAKLLFAAEKDGRIGAFPYDPALPVETSWDIGVDDYTSIWFWQCDGETATVVDFWETSGEGAEDIVRQALPELNPDEAARYSALAELGRRSYRYGQHWLPHDVRNREWGQGARSRAETLMGFGVKPLRVGSATKPDDRIAAVRQLLPHVRFNDTPRIKKGLAHLRRYSRRWNAQLETYGQPLHDEHSHAADAFGEFAINVALKPVVEVESELEPTPRELSQVLLPGEPEPVKGRKRIRL